MLIEQVTPGPATVQPAAPKPKRRSPTRSVPKPRGAVPKPGSGSSAENGGTTQRPHRFQPGNATRFKPGNPGRRKGTLNKVTREMSDLARSLTTGSPAYLAKLKQRLVAGKCHPSVEVALLHYAHGRPPEKIEVSGTEGGAVVYRIIW